MSRWILITGCSSGIGFDAAVSLKDRGYNVIASVKNGADTDALKERGIQHVIELDLRDSESISRSVDYAKEVSDGNISALFNNGAYGQPGAVEDLSRDTLRAQFETNLFGVQELTNLLLPTFLDQPDARIVNCSSVLGMVAMPFRGAYNASKFALEGLTDTLRLELRETSVKVVIIEPGPILTRFRQNALQALEDNIDISASRHQLDYEKSLARLKKQGAAMPFTLGPEAVTKKLVRALESNRPKPRYYVTVPTYFMALCRRILSNRMLDNLLARSR